jgi:hypothetical protein
LAENTAPPFYILNEKKRFYLRKKYRLLWNTIQLNKRLGQKSISKALKDFTNALKDFK